MQERKKKSRQTKKKRKGRSPFAGDQSMATLKPTSRKLGVLPTNPSPESPPEQYAVTGKLSTSCVPEQRGAKTRNASPSCVWI